MIVISPKFIGNLHICEKCGALLKWEPSDVYEGNFIYCPLCKEKQALNYEYVEEVKDA